MREREAPSFIFYIILLAEANFIFFSLTKYWAVLILDTSIIHTITRESHSDSHVDIIV